MRAFVAGMLRRIPLSRAGLGVKVPLAVAGAAVLMLCILAFLSFSSAQKILRTGIEAQFEGILQSRSNQLKGWFAQQERELLVQAANSTTENALFQFDTAWYKDPMEAREQLTAAYITENPHALDQRHLLDQPSGKHAYHRLHVQFHSYFRKLASDGGYADVLLVNLDGDVVYSVNKQADFATNLGEGPWSETALGNVYRAATEAQDGTVVFRDFEEYAAREDVPHAFFATKVISRVGSPVGVLIFEYHPMALVPALANGPGFGSDLETLLIGADGHLRASSLERIDDDTHEADPQMTEEMRRVMTGATLRYATELNHDGAEFLVSMQPFSYSNQSWILKAQVPLKQAVAPVTELRNQLLWLIPVFVVAAALMGFALSRFLTQPILRLQYRVAAMRDSDLDSAMPSMQRNDEIGHLACDLEELRAKLKVAAELEDEKHRKSEDQVRVVDILSGAISHLEKGELTVQINEVFPSQYEVLRTGLNKAVSRQCEAITSLSESAGMIDSTASRIEQSMEMVRARAEKQAGELEETSTSLRELTSLVSESADNTLNAEEGMRRTIDEAIRNEKVVNRAKEAMSQISASAAAVQKVTSLIDTIAFQTNLLALNASVEATRAGPAGRGFAVVASEVRALAGRTSHAASEINELLAQNALAISDGSDMVDNVSVFFGNMNEELQEASKSIKAITDAAQEQSQRIGQIDSTVARLDNMTRQNVQMVTEVHESGLTMVQEAARLRKTAGMFQINSQEEVAQAPTEITGQQEGTLDSSVQKRA